MELSIEKRVVADISEATTLMRTAIIYSIPSSKRGRRMAVFPPTGMQRLKERPQITGRRALIKNQIIVL